MEDNQLLQLLSVLGILLFGLGAFLFFWLMRRPLNRGLRYSARGGHARGVVVRHAPTGETETGNTMYTPEIEFYDRAGRPFRAIAGTQATHPTPIGTQVEIAYDVNDPTQAVAIGFARILAWIGTGVAAVFVVLAAACFLGLVALSL